jgi:peptidoglycan hydrolase-like protein with peptidoglycan-binding domain
MNDRRGAPSGPAAPLAAAAREVLSAQPHPPALARGARGAREPVVDVQRALMARGLYAGPADGLMGPATAAAIRQLQRARGEAPTGSPTAPQIRALLAP